MAMFVGMGTLIIAALIPVGAWMGVQAGAAVVEDVGAAVGVGEAVEGGAGEGAVVDVAVAAEVGVEDKSKNES